ncbi:MAG: hypothetical protein Unbinned2990contig1002_8 [Prokaryotic dsDNA virus sp.]|nr:MAG: hypothetical protein Unbinned2990contig1002_8 [Prokaryotic dsDNA virus sp.]
MATPPIAVNGKRISLSFNSDEDVWKIIHKLIEEAKEMNKLGKSFDIGASLLKQIPFFACKNVLLSKEYQSDISKYLYCKNFGIKPYEGSYKEQPSRWVSKTFIIKNALIKRDNMLQKQHMNKVKDD